MWIRGELKARAKQALRENGYWIALAVVVIVWILSGLLGAGGGGPRVEYRFDQGDFDSFARGFWGVGLVVAGLAAFAATAYAIFVANPITVGKCRFFLEHRLRPSSVGVVFRPFGQDYLNVVKTVFLSGLFVFLWSLLFIIPGIVKAFQYAMVPYIVAENPGLEWRRALALSRQMTDGCKFDIFVLYLSFIGWFLLGLLALGVGVLFVIPYVEATLAELYATLRQKALERGDATSAELPGVY